MKIFGYTFFISVVLLVSCVKDTTPKPLVENKPQITAELCDSIPKSYSADVAPIFSTNCVSCHSSSSPSGGYVLETHADYSANLTIVLDAINHQPGTVAMPYQQAKLSDSLIQVIECWANDGALNN